MAALRRPRELAEHLGVARSTLPVLEAEGIPCHVLHVGPHGRRLVRYDFDEVDEWIAGRRERQVRATLDGERYARKAARR